MPTINIDAIFMPTKELDANSAYLFAGRQAILSKAVSSLTKPQSSVAIFGDRGVGKSSLGRMLMGLLESRIAPEAIGLRLDLALPRRSCVRVAWTHDLLSLEHLLYRLFDPNLEAGSSFAQQFPSIAGKYRNKFEQISLKELTDESSARTNRLGPNQVLVHDLFRTAEDAYVASARNSETAGGGGLVIVIDEMDQAKDHSQTAGLGTLIKNSQFQFVTIGIGAAITDILEDHLSAERQFAGGQFLVEPFTRSEVRQLFDKASAQAAAQGFRLSFGESFCDLVAEDFSGYPAQIQAFGLDIVMNYQNRLEAGQEVRVRKSDYVHLLALRETSPNRDIRSMNDVDAGVDGSVPRWEVLKAIIAIRDKENVSWITFEKLRKKLSEAYQVRLSGNLKELVKSKVLEANDRSATSVNIASPAILCEIKRRIRQSWDPKARLNK